METHTVMMPRELTAENGVKALLIGEFKENVPVQCSDCHGLGHDQNLAGCKTCDGLGILHLDVPVSWTTIKAIYTRVVEHLGV